MLADIKRLVEVAERVQAKQDNVLGQVGTLRGQIDTVTNALYRPKLNGLQ